MPDQERNSPERQKLYLESQELIHEYPGNLHCYDDFPGNQPASSDSPLKTESGEILN
jgi:hypothetical protein